MYPLVYKFTQIRTHVFKRDLFLFQLVENQYPIEFSDTFPFYFPRVQMESKSNDIAIQCDLQSNSRLVHMKDISTQTEQPHLPVHSSPILLPSESEVSDLEDYHPKDLSKDWKYFVSLLDYAYNTF